MDREPTESENRLLEEVKQRLMHRYKGIIEDSELDDLLTIVSKNFHLTLAKAERIRHENAFA